MWLTGERSGQEYAAWQAQPMPPPAPASGAGAGGREVWMYQSCMSEGCDPGIDRKWGCDKNASHGHWPCESGW